MQVVISRDALVIRFRPTEPDSVLQSAVKEQRQSGRYGLSVFAGTATEGEDSADVQQRLLQVAELDGIDPTKNKNYFVCTEAGKLLDLGFAFWKYDDDPDEKADHYLVDLGEQPTLGDVSRFLGAFGPAVRRPT